MAAPADDPRRRRGRNYALLVLLAALAALVFAVTVAKLGAVGAPV